MDVQTQRREVFDPSTTKYEREELPTVTIKDAARATEVGPGSAILTCSALGGGTEMRITALRFACGTHADAEFFLRDRGGTFAYPYLSSAGQETLHGAPNEPLHVVRGTFVIGLVSTIGTVDRISASYEGIVRFDGTETWE